MHTHAASLIEVVITALLYGTVAGRAGYVWAIVRRSGNRAKWAGWLFFLSGVFILCLVTGYMPMLDWWPVWLPRWTHVALNAATASLVYYDLRYDVLGRIARGEGELGEARDALREAYAAVGVPIVYVTPGKSVRDAVFEWVNPKACERWRRTFEQLTSVPYRAFLAGADEETDAVAQRSDEGAVIQGFVNTYTVPGSSRVAWNEWRQIGQTGYWQALDVDARYAERQAREDLRTTRLRALRVFGDAIPDPDTLRR